MKPTHPLPIKATYHDACHLRHAQQICKQPRQLLEMIPGLELVPLPESELCCGAAGSYNLTQPEMAERLGDRKAANILATGAQAVFTGNVGCLMQITRHLKTVAPDVWVRPPGRRPVGELQRRDAARAEVGPATAGVVRLSRHRGPPMKTYQITLPDEFAAFVDRMIAESKFDDLDHLFLYAVAQVEDEVHRDESIDQEWLRKEIQKGIDSANRGEVAPLDMDAIRKRVEARLASEKEPAHAPGDTDRPS